MTIRDADSSSSSSAPARVAAVPRVQLEELLKQFDWWLKSTPSDPGWSKDGYCDIFDAEGARLAHISNHVSGASLPLLLKTVREQANRMSEPVCPRFKADENDADMCQHCGWTEASHWADSSVAAVPRAIEELRKALAEWDDKQSTKLAIVREDAVWDAARKVAAAAPGIRSLAPPEQTALFQLGAFQLHSGEHADFKIDCDALTDRDWDALALMVTRRVPPFDDVEGVPRGGLNLAAAIARNTARRQGPVLIVDDVLTTGASMEAQRAGRDAIGAVIFARGPCPTWITPLFQMVAGEASPSLPSAPQPIEEKEEKEELARVDGERLSERQDLPRLSNGDT